MIRAARKALDDKKGRDIVVLDVRGVSTVTDYYLIATGNSAPHVKALTEEVQVALKKEGHRAYRKAGTPESGWMIADFVDAVVHVFSPEARGYYALEQLWNDAPRVEP